MIAADRILTTHTGSLPRPADIAEMLIAQARGDALDDALLERRIAEDVTAVVRKQVECGIDIVNDGEIGKFSYSTYVKERLAGSRTSAVRAR